MLMQNDYKIHLLQFQNKSFNLALGYVPGIIRHYYHGSKQNRKYTERREILVRAKFLPSVHLTKNRDGVIVPTRKFPKGLCEAIMRYFLERKEDD